MLVIYRTAGGGFAASGDSGSAVVGQTENCNELDFVGLLSVLMIKSVLCHDIALVPAQKVFQHPKTGTGVEWTVRSS